MPEMELSQFEVYKAIADYYYDEEKDGVFVYHDLKIVDNHPKITYYLVEQLDYEGIKSNNRKQITEKELVDIFNNYLKQFNSALVEYKYIGGVHHVGYFFDEDTPWCSGIELYTKKLEKPYSLSMKKVDK